MAENNVQGDKIEGDQISGDKIAGDKVSGNKTVIEQQTIIYQSGSSATSPTTPRGIFGLYPFNQHFFGRDAELDTLHSLLQEASSVSICPVISGMGGLGKTQLVAHYARRHVADYPDGIFWITAANLNNIRPQLADFCVALGLLVADPQRSGDLTEQKVTAFKGYLDQHPHALLIFDNVEEPDHLRTRLIGVQITALTLGGKIILTTRRRRLPGDKFAELALQRLLPEPARQILTTARADLASDPNLDHLCTQFGYLPLMLNLAAAALKKRGGPITGYLQRLQTLGAEKLHSEVAKVSLDDYHKGLGAVLHEQWAMLRDENACLLLRVAGQLPEAAIIPTARLGLLAGLVDADEWERSLSDALDELEAASLVERVDVATLRLHPLVRDFATGLTSDNERSTLRIACAQHLNSAFYDLARLGREYEHRGITELIADLLTAIDLLQLQKPVSTPVLNQLQYLLKLLRREMHKLQGNSSSWKRNRLWSQLFYRAKVMRNQILADQCEAYLKGNAYWRVRWLAHFESLSLEQTLLGHKGRIDTVAVLSDKRIISGAEDCTIKIWNLETGQVEQTLMGHTNTIHDIKVLDTTRIISASGDAGRHDDTLKVWNLEAGCIELTLNGHESSVNAVVILSPTCVISASFDHTLKVWDLKTGEVIQTLIGHTESVNDVAVIDNQRIVSASSDHTLKIWNLDTGEVNKTLIEHTDSVEAVLVFDDQRIISASSDKTLKVWNLKSGKVEKTLVGHTHRVVAIAKLDHCRIVSTSTDKTLKVWNLDTDEIERNFIGHGSRVSDVAIIDNEQIVSASWDKTLKIWNLSIDDTEQMPNRHLDIVCAVKLLDTTRVVSASDDKTLKIWNLDTGQLEQTLTGHQNLVRDVAVLNPARIVSASFDQTLKVWCLDPFYVEQTLLEHTDHVNAVAIIDDNHIVSGSGDATLKIWNLDTGLVEQTLSGHEQLVLDVVVINPQYIIATSVPRFLNSDSLLKVWNLKTGKAEKTLKEHVSAIAVIDINQIVFASYDGTLKVWNVQTDEIEQMFIGHQSHVSGISVIDANRIISIGDDHILNGWDLQTEKELASIELDNSLWCVTAILQDNCIVVVVGDASGSLYCLELMEPKLAGA